MATITGVRVEDVRFPTSATADGSDAMNKDADYSAAYVVLETDAADPADPGRTLGGYGLTFTIGRGNDIVAEAARQQAAKLIGRDVDRLTADMGAVYRDLTTDSQLRWLGPEKGVIHLATAAVVNAAWDLYAKREGKPLWKLLADMTPDELVALVDFRYISDEITPAQRLALADLVPVSHLDPRPAPSPTRTVSAVSCLRQVAVSRSSPHQNRPPRRRVSPSCSRDIPIAWASRPGPAASKRRSLIAARLSLIRSIPSSGSAARRRTASHTPSRAQTMLAHQCIP
jgi:hypothetical protein